MNQDPPSQHPPSQDPPRQDPPNQNPPAGTDSAAFLVLVTDLRPQLHRYCARLTGSVIDGEDVVQDTIAKALTARDSLDPATPLRPWLFRVAHNRALDLLRSRAVRAAEPIEAAADRADTEALDPLERLMSKEALNTAVSRFVELPAAQRSAVILKDVLDCPLQEIADLLNLTIDAVKAHLARGRRRLKAINAQARPDGAVLVASAAVTRYVDLFNRRDWSALRALLADDVELNQAGRPRRAGAADVGNFFSFYEGYEPVRLEAAWLEGREAIAVFATAAGKPDYFMWLEWRDDRIAFIHDYRYARYVMDGAELVRAAGTSAP